MTLKEKFENIEVGFPADESIKIADDYAIGFAIFIKKEYGDIHMTMDNYKKSLEMYKKSQK